MNVRLKNRPSQKQLKVLHEECAKEFDKHLEYYNKEATLQILHILRFDYGWGQKRLKEFFDKLSSMQLKTINRYEVLDKDVPSICEIKLRDSGIDLSDFFV